MAEAKLDVHGDWRRIIVQNPPGHVWCNIATCKTQTDLPEEMREKPASLSDVDDLRNKLNKLNMVIITSTRSLHGTIAHPNLRPYIKGTQRPISEQWYEDRPIKVRFEDLNIFSTFSPPAIAFTPILSHATRNSAMVTCSLIGMPTANGFQFCIRTNSDVPAVVVGFSKIVPESLVEAVQWMAIAP